MLLDGRQPSARPATRRPAPGEDARRGPGDQREPLAELVQYRLEHLKLLGRVRVHVGRVHQDVGDRDGQVAQAGVDIGEGGVVCLGSAIGCKRGASPMPMTMAVKPVAAAALTGGSLLGGQKHASLPTHDRASGIFVPSDPCLRPSAPCLRPSAPCLRPSAPCLRPSDPCPHRGLDGVRRTGFRIYKSPLRKAGGSHLSELLRECP